jgi:hypothetical protein
MVNQQVIILLYQLVSLEFFTSIINSAEAISILCFNRKTKHTLKEQPGPGGSSKRIHQTMQLQLESDHLFIQP